MSCSTASAPDKSIRASADTTVHDYGDLPGNTFDDFAEALNSRAQGLVTPTVIRNDQR